MAKAIGDHSAPKSGMAMVISVCRYVYVPQIIYMHTSGVHYSVYVGGAIFSVIYDTT